MNILQRYLGFGKPRRQKRQKGYSNGNKSEWSGYDFVKQEGSQSLEGNEPDLKALSFCATLSGTNLVSQVSKLKFKRKLKTHTKDRALVSIVIPCLNQELVTAECLKSIAQALPTEFSVEVIIADNGSTDHLYKFLQEHNELRVISFAKNIGFGSACNEAAKIAKGKFIFFLNNDAQIAPGCIEALVAAFKRPNRSSKIGIVGPKILSFDGRLQEAGCILNTDGTGTLVGFGRDHRSPRYNYERFVGHVSGAAIMILRSAFWSVGGFDIAFAPAYCEDVDLSLKIAERGLKILYTPKAIVAHHLGRTSDSLALPNMSRRQRIARNRDLLVKRWYERISSQKLRLVAFYLPQFHPIPQNDIWWGKGFTEWTNVTKARPSFVGHKQPRYPADLGYYDLRVPEVMEHQVDLAKRYGLSGFCYYYYSFGGQRMLDLPLEQILKTEKPRFPFCLCWANENWTRRWDGMDHNVLVAQNYDKKSNLEIIKDLVRYFRSPQYIKIDGKPLILIYRIKEIPEPRQLVETWRNYCRKIGIGEICLAMVESFDLSRNPQNPAEYGFDLTVEFPAHGMVQDKPIKVEKLNNSWEGRVHDYRALATAFMNRIEPGFRRLRSVLVGWDNSARHKNKSLVLEHATPGAFQAWLEWTCNRTKEQNFGDDRIVFISSWNEWAEGSYLEPDNHYGHSYLQAVRNALEAAERGGDVFVEE